MDATALDTITGAFVDALQSGTAALAAYSIPLLGVFAIIAFYVQLGPVLAGGGASAGDAVAGVLLSVLKTGVFYWLLVNFAPLTTAAFETFLQWGLTPGGGSSGDVFTAPSEIVNLGFRAAKPLVNFGSSFKWWVTSWFWFTLSFYVIAYWIVVIAFFLVALHLMMTMIEFHLAVLVGTVLVPWGVLQPTAFFTEFSLGGLTGGLVRILVTGAFVGIAVPLFEMVRVNTTGGGDPTLYSSIVVAATSGVFALLSWVIPGRAAAIAGRGVSLAVHGGTLMAGAAGGLRGVIAVTMAIRGISSMIRRR
jgi:type IV secretion system protein TrbL